MTVQTTPAEPHPAGRGSLPSGHRNSLDLFFDPAGIDDPRAASLPRHPRRTRSGRTGGTDGAHRIAAYQFPEQAAQALGALWQRADYLARVAEGDAGREALPVSSEVVGWLASASAAGHTQLGEAETRPILQAYGLPQPQAELARTADEATAVAARIGYPVALKIVSSCRDGAAGLRAHRGHAAGSAVWAVGDV